MVKSNRSLSRGLALLRVFNEMPSPTLTGIATRMELTKATCLRYLRTLQDEGYLTLNDQTKRYQLRPLILELGYAALSSMSLPVAAEPEMESLATRTGGSVNLAVLDGDEIVVVGRSVASHETRKLVTMNIHVGTRLPAHCTALGRLLIASSKQDIRKFVSATQLVKMTPKTLVHRAHLAREIEKSRRQGWAVVEEQLGLGYSAISVLVDIPGQQLFGLAVSVSAGDYTRVRLEREVLPPLQAAADRLVRTFSHGTSGAGQLNQLGIVEGKRTGRYKAGSQNRF